MKKYVIIFLIVIGILVINITGVNADTAWDNIIKNASPECADCLLKQTEGLKLEFSKCESVCNFASLASNVCNPDSEISASYKCDYLDDTGLSGKIDYSLLFVEQSGDYCTEITNMELEVNGGLIIPPGEWDENRRKITYLTLSEDTIKNAIENQTCPSIKTVFDVDGFGSTRLTGLTVTDPSNAFIISHGEAFACGFSNTVGYWDSFCLITAGNNFRVISKSEAQEAIEAGTDDRLGVDVEKIKEWAAHYGYDVDSLGDNCSIINPNLKEILNMAFWFICIAGIVLVVVMTALGFVKAIVGSDEEKFRDAFKHLLTRIIVIIVLLLLPTILSFIIDIINNNITGTVSIGEDGNVFCDITGNN